jgi:anaerobic magnesium-protoporphyrin IX monomethyl ester cyclase
VEGKKTGTTAILLQPPPGDITGPYPALSYLKAYAEARGHRVLVKDLGIEAVYYLTRKEQLRTLVQKADHVRNQLELKGYLDREEQRLYGMLGTTAWIEQNPAAIPDTINAFKNPRKFKDYRQYKRSCHVLDAFFRLLSVTHFPTEISASDFTNAQTVNSKEGILAHSNGSLNPYVEYYEHVLFPQISDDQPVVIGISMEFASQSVQTMVLGKLLKERFPNIHITMGGAYLSQWVLLMREPHLSWLFSCTDSVVCGEGEDALVDLLDRLATNESLDGVPNLIHVDRSRETVLRFDTLEYPDIATLPPPDFSDLDLGAYLIPETILPYCISRGCYWGKCVFCQNRYGDNRMRRYQTVPIDKALDEMSSLAQRYHTNHFNFSNDVIDPGYLKRFSQTAIDSGKKFVWNTDLRAEKRFDPDLCTLMAQAGLNSVAIGMESGCQRTLDAMDKGKNVETVKQVMKSLYDNGVATQAMGMFGFPGETEAEAEKTVTFIEDNIDRVSYYVMGLLMVMPGSRMHENPEEHGVTSISYEGNALMFPQPIWTSDTRISPGAVNRLYARLERLEDLYSIHEYPYVGSLSTNHSFLYFQHGPDILKRLREEEKLPQERLLAALSATNAQTRNKKLKSTVPRMSIPASLVRSPYPIERILMHQRDGNVPHGIHTVEEHEYLASPLTAVFPVGPTERRLLKLIEGRKNLKAILGKFQGAELNRVVSFLMTLVSEGIVVC